MFGRSRASGSRIDGYDLSSPEGWYPIELHADSSAWAGRLAAQVTGGEGATADALAEMLVRVAAEVGETDAFAAAVWVPHPETAAVHAALGLSFVEPDPGVPFSAEQLGQAILASDPPTLEVLQREVNLMTLPAGESVVHREIVAARPGGEVEERIVFTVFAPGAGEAFELAFASPHLEEGEGLAADAVTIAQSLVLRLA